MVDECRTVEVRAEGEGSGIDDHPLAGLPIGMLMLITYSEHLIDGTPLAERLLLRMRIECW
jgi:hypothetical protein